MICNHLFVVPTDETIEYFNRNISGCPFAIHPDQFKVTLMVTKDELDADPTAVYQAKAGNTRMFYNPAVRGSSLIMPLISPELVLEHGKLMEQGTNPVFTPFYSPHINMVDAVPPLKKYIRGWINSLSGIFRNDPTILTFTGETVEVVDFSFPPDYYYDQEMMNIGLQMGR